MLGNTKILLFLLNKKLYEHADIFCKHIKFYPVNQWENIPWRLNSVVSLRNDTTKVTLKLS